MPVSAGAAGAVAPDEPLSVEVSLELEELDELESVVVAGASVTAESTSSGLALTSLPALRVAMIES